MSYKLSLSNNQLHYIHSYSQRFESGEQPPFRKVNHCRNTITFYFGHPSSLEEIRQRMVLIHPFLKLERVGQRPQKGLKEIIHVRKPADQISLHRMLILKILKGGNQIFSLQEMCEKELLSRTSATSLPSISIIPVSFS